MTDFFLHHKSFLKFWPQKKRLLRHNLWPIFGWISEHIYRNSFELVSRSSHNSYTKTQGTLIKQKNPKYLVYDHVQPQINLILEDFNKIIWISLQTLLYSQEQPVFPTVLATQIVTSVAQQQDSYYSVPLCSENLIYETKN